MHFPFTEQKKELTGYLKSRRNLHTQSPVMWLNFSLSSCLCWCCVDKTSTNYSVGFWLSQYQQNVEVTYRKMQPNGVPGRRNTQWLFPECGSLFISSESSERTLLRALADRHGHEEASSLGTTQSSLRSSCLYSIFAIDHNLGFGIVRWMEVNREERKKLENNQVSHFFPPIG